MAPEDRFGILIEACKRYYVDSLPTGLSDDEYDALEAEALNEGFSVRDYVFEKWMKGKKTMNHYITKFKKQKVVGCSMLEAMQKVDPSHELYWNLKYDGSSIAIYLDGEGHPRNIVTVGNLNTSSMGVDQTWKLLGHLPTQFPKDIVAIQCEALIDTERWKEGVPERSRQKANGLINSKDMADEVEKYLILVAYRYYLKDGTMTTDYREELGKIPVKTNEKDGHIMFAPATTWTLKELEEGQPGYMETDLTKTPLGTFLNDGWVAYSKDGVCQGALKYSGAGQGDITTIVKGIQWNDQTPKGKDSWSANVLIDPVLIRGVEIKKPSAGSVGKLVNERITKGAEVSIILANSTIPMVGQTIKAGNGDYQWPTCACGYTMGEKDVYGSLLKCGNPMCSQRVGRMKKYLESLPSLNDLDLGPFLVIDRFKWEGKGVSVETLLKFIEKDDEKGFYTYLEGPMTTDLQKKNLGLVRKAAWETLKDEFNKRQIQ